MRFLNRGGTDEPAIRLMFLCVENAGRSQMAAALAERERERRGLDDRVEIRSAGTRPADAVHEVVVEALAEIGIDVSNRVPTVVQLEELKRMDFLVMMGCYVSEFDPATFVDDTREWDLTDPDDADLDTVRDVRDEIDQRVAALFDDIERHLETRAEQ